MLLVSLLLPLGVLDVEALLDGLPDGVAPAKGSGFGQYVPNSL